MKINGEHFRTIWPNSENKQLIEVIDQRILPYRFETKKLTTVEDTHAAIKDMVVRGAGLIGATAGFGMYLASLVASPANMKNDMKQACAYLKTARPTARNLGWGR